MKLKKIMSALLSGIMLLTSSGFISAGAAQTAEKQQEDYAAYLFAYFRDNREEALCYGVSRDGYAFRTLNDGEPVFNSTLGTQHLRDPYIFRGEDNYFYIVVTDMNSATGWASQSTIAIYKTKDLINIDNSILIDYKDFEGFNDCNRAWAPQIIWCPEHDNGEGKDKGAYMIYLAIQNASTADSLGTLMYKHFATDLMDADTYTTPEMMLTGQTEGKYDGVGAIDGDIIHDEVNDRYLMYFDGVRVAACDTIDGTYTELSEDGEGIYQGKSPFADYRSEGSNMFKRNKTGTQTEDKWIYCADGDAFGTGYLVFETTDFANYTQIGGRGAAEQKIDYDFTPRHGYVIPITDNELDALMDKYGYVDLPDRFSENPLTNNLTLPYTESGYKIAGNITLPESVTADGTKYDVTWESSNPDVIDTEAHVFTDAEIEEKGYNENYKEYPAGKVTRPANTDEKVTLTASIDGTEYTKKFVVTVKKAPQMSYEEMRKKDQEEGGVFTGYLYAYFKGGGDTLENQQTYFASSDDGMHWTDLGDNKPCVRSTLGTTGLRDHYIIRSAEGDRFYLLATDLFVGVRGGNWGKYAMHGSKSLMIWESDDLVNWSKQRMVQIADLDDTTNTGCAWAPEAIYDKETGEYIVYWSGHEMDSTKDDTYNVENGDKVVYYSKTRDFYSFTPQKKYVFPLVDDENSENSDGNKWGTTDSFIDTTMIQGDDDNFYRITKYEDLARYSWRCGTKVFLDAAKYPLGDFKRVETNLAENDFDGVEGPGWFKFNKDDQTEDRKYCLMLDGYNGANRGVGFFPTVVSALNNMDNIQFTKLPTSEIKMATGAKHGGILPLTQEEYERVNEFYASTPLTDLSTYTGTKNLVFDIADTYPDYPAGWKLPTDKSLDNNTDKFLGFNGNVEMGDGYGRKAEWATIQFKLAANSGGDTVIRDIDGKPVIGYCYASGSDGLWVGHGERSFGGNKLDQNGTKRLENYLKTELGVYSDQEKTGHATYAQYELCTIVIENKDGAVEGTDYSGKYYTVKTYIDGKHISTEYYKDNFNGIGSIESKAKQYYGSLKIYAPQEKLAPIEVADKFKLFDIDFEGENTTAKIGKATGNGTFTYVDGEAEGSKAAYFDGSTNYLSLNKADGGILLSGKDNIAITLKAKPEQPSTTNGWYFYASWSNNAQNSKSRSYVGLLDSGTNITGERFRNSTGDPTVSGASALGQWQEITYIIGENKNELYIDGKFCGEADFTGKENLSTILGDRDSIVTYIGRANWGSGEYYKGAIDDVTIYDFAPFVEFEASLDAVKSDITLPTATVEKNGYSLTWESSNPDVISNTGKVTVPEVGKADVTLTAIIQFDDTTLRRSYTAKVKSDDYCDIVLDIKNEKDVDIQPDMYGLFFEDISYGADGGLYAELIQNRNFEELLHRGSNGSETAVLRPLYKWHAVDGAITAVTKKADGNVVEINKDGSEKGAYDGAYKPLDGGKRTYELLENDNENPTYLKLVGKSFKNEGFKNGNAGGVYVEQGKKYNISFYAMTDDYNGAIKAKVVKGGDTAFTAVAEKVADTDNKYAANGWTKYEVQATADKTLRGAEFVIELDTSATVYFDMISMIPDDAVEGIFRKDMFDLLNDLNPGFVRFPGGCVIEGYDIDNRYQWKRSVGPQEERKQNWNRWLDNGEDGMSGYNQTLGLGYYEYFLLCEKLGCSAVPVLSVGIGCEYEAGRFGSFVPIYKENTTEYTDEFRALIDDAIDLVAFATGTDLNNKWTKLRNDMGHPEPFNLKAIGIGNEQGKIDPGWTEWYKRYELFEQEIHKVYPDVKLINTSGPFASGGYTEKNWTWIREKQAENSKFTYAVDEHFYMSPEWFLDNDNRYDNYDRKAPVFAGEYAANGTYENTLNNALAEAAFMTGMERNADVVFMSALAPLFCNYNCRNWSPNMIWCDETGSHTTPNYYVQQMYMQNNGSYTLKNDVKSAEKSYQSVSYDEKTGDVIVKLVNPYDYDVKTKINLDSSLAMTGEVTQILLTNEDKFAKNSMEQPDNVTLEETSIKLTNGGEYMLGANSFAVLRIHTGEPTYLVNLTKLESTDGKLSYELTPETDVNIAEYDVYTAVYSDNGMLVKVFKNDMSGQLDIDADKNYEVKVMVWEKNTMKPAANHTVIKQSTSVKN